MIFSSWGVYPKIKSAVFRFAKEESLKNIIATENQLIPRGNGRSYGDSALSNNVIDVKPHDYFKSFDDGLLHVQAGVLISEILEAFVPQGWFLKVTPGTKLITIGGAIASDVHGKNHHVEGCFSESVKEFTIMLADGEVVTCSKESTPELFRATCGGMGLTGVILDAKIYLKKINSKYIDQTTIKTKNLRDTFEAFEEYQNIPYSVAWVDCLAKGDEIGKCLLMTGDFRNDGKLDYQNKHNLSIPFNFPSFVLSSWSVRAFNWLYYGKITDRLSKQKVDIDTFFYPLDAIAHWNRIYGKSGFTQYQLILPKEHSYDGLEEILKTISDSGKGSFLAVLKLYGKANENYLSFPIEGYSLALDFKIEKGLFALLDRLDEIVVKYNGRIYLTKDVRVSKQVFEQGYPQVETFRRFRKTNKMDVKFQSLQSKRVGI
jgi:decaprenylphospho-beta-D-ribofuranose 2-oxidase